MDSHRTLTQLNTEFYTVLLLWLVCLLAGVKDRECGLVLGEVPSNSVFCTDEVRWQSSSCCHLLFSLTIKCSQAKFVFPAAPLKHSIFQWIQGFSCAVCVSVAVFTLKHSIGLKLPTSSPSTWLQLFYRGSWLLLDLSAFLFGVCHSSGSQPA